jgi:hypothetical protein
VTSATTVELANIFDAYLTRVVIGAPTPDPGGPPEGQDNRYW